MVDGTRWTIGFLVLLLVMPTVLAAAPQGVFPSAYSVGGQQVSALAVDPATAKFGITVPTYDSTKLPALPGEPTRRDVYLCDFDGSGCRGLNHDSTFGSGSAQVADATSFTSGSGLTARYVVGGPGRTVSAWSNIGDRPTWTKDFGGDNMNVVAVAIEPTAGSQVVAAGSSSLSTTGRITVFAGDTGASVWSYDLTVRPTSMDYSRFGGLLVVGTTRGVQFFNPANAAAPSTLSETSPVDVGSVGNVAISDGGTAVLARTTSGIEYIEIRAGKPVTPTWNRQLSGVTAIALSGDGQHFAAASGSKIYFYRHLDTSLIAMAVGEYDAPAAVTSLAYDRSGSLLVATAGSRVIGFGQDRFTPIWNFDATLPANGGLDAPLKRAYVSEDAGRIVVAGATKVMPYKTVASAIAAVEGATTRTISPGAASTFTFDITNTGSLTDTYTFVVTRPVGWTGTTPEPLTLLPDATGQVNLTLEAPAGQPPGADALKLELRSKLKNNDIITRTTLNLTIPRAVSLFVEPSQKQVELQAGVGVPVEVTVRNRGNAEGIVNLSATQSLSRGVAWAVDFTQVQLRIPANGAATTQMLLTPPRDASSGDRNLVTIVAKEGNSQATETVTAFVNPEFSVDVNTGLPKLEFVTGVSKTFTLNITNRGNTEDTYNVTANVTPFSQESQWSVRLDEKQLTIPRGQTRLVSITIRPSVALPEDGASLVVKAVSLGSGERIDDSVSIALVPSPTEEPEGKRGLPAPPLALILGALAVAAFAGRLRRGRA